MTNQDPDLECRHVVELVTDYLEGALPTDNAERLEQHLLICDACMTYVNQHRTVISRLSQLGQPDPAQAAAPESARNAALQLFRRMQKGGPGQGEP